MCMHLCCCSGDAEGVDLMTKYEILSYQTICDDFQLKPSSKRPVTNSSKHQKCKISKVTNRAVVHKNAYA